MHLFYLWLTITTMTGDVVNTTVEQHAAPFLYLEDCEEYANGVIEQLFEDNENVIVKYTCKPSMRMRI